MTKMPSLLLLLFFFSCLLFSCHGHFCWVELPDVVCCMLFQVQLFHLDQVLVGYFYGNWHFQILRPGQVSLMFQILYYSEFSSQVGFSFKLFLWMLSFGRYQCWQVDSCLVQYLTNSKEYKKNSSSDLGYNRSEWSPLYERCWPGSRQDRYKI